MRSAKDKKRIDALRRLRLGKRTGRRMRVIVKVTKSVRFRLIDFGGPDARFQAMSLSGLYRGPKPLTEDEYHFLKLWSGHEKIVTLPRGLQIPATMGVKLKVPFAFLSPSEREAARHAPTTYIGDFQRFGVSPPSLNKDLSTVGDDEEDGRTHIPPPSIKR